jgi:hypothetical protein
MDRNNHAKVVSLDPNAIDRLLTEELEIPVTDGGLVPWNDGAGIRDFFAEVGEIVLEVMRVETS